MAQHQHERTTIKDKLSAWHSKKQDGAAKHKAATPAWYNSIQTYIQPPVGAVWSPRTYRRFADEAYTRNVVAHAAMSMIAQGGASVPLKLRSRDGHDVAPQHPLRALLLKPSVMESGRSFVEKVLHYRMLSGNVFIQAVSPMGEAPRELHVLRPDRVSVVAGRGGVPSAYRYQVGEQITDFPVDAFTGASRILHIKNFHPNDDWYGLSPVEAAAYSIDQHNQSSAWNQALLQNGARPSGALVVRAADGNGAGHLSEDQYYRIKTQVDEQFSGAAHAGRPLLLEGGLEWKEMSLSPKDMDFLEARHAAAREIALAFGVPPQLLGITGDNTYANLAEARLALWEQTIVPMVEQVVQALNGWLCPMFDNQLEIVADTEAISALAPRRESLWSRVKDADFLSAEEKRRLLGLQ